MNILFFEVLDYTNFLFENFWYRRKKTNKRYNFDAKRLVENKLASRNDCLKNTDRRDFVIEKMADSLSLIHKPRASHKLHTTLIILSHNKSKSCVIVEKITCCVKHCIKK